MTQVTATVYNANLKVHEETSLTVSYDGKVSFSLTEEELNTKNILPTLSPYLVKYKAENDTNFTTQRIFYITPVVITAIDQLRYHVDRLDQDYHVDELKLTEEDYIQILLRGRDKFNLAAPQVTNISMIRATGPIYAAWFECSRIEALRTRFLDEGSLNFNLGGASVTLDRDITAILEAEISRSEATLQSDLDALKGRMKKKAVLVGDGDDSGLWSGKIQGATGYRQGPLSPDKGFGLDSNLWHQAKY